MKRRGGDEDVGDDDGGRDAGAHDGDLLRRYGAHRADGLRAHADTVTGEWMRVDNRLGDEDRRQKQEDCETEQTHRGEANTQFHGRRSNSGDTIAACDTGDGSRGARGEAEKNSVLSASLCAPRESFRRALERIPSWNKGRKGGL